MVCVREKVLTDERLHPQSALVVEWFTVWKSLQEFFDISISHDPYIMPKSMIKKSLSNAILHPILFQEMGVLELDVLRIEK
ncbi:hypothetical protein SAMN05421858_4807 [Haladaptatus litoreus]|uniref:Uncharacterized protein n=1 Tax=Haladaptatus litoreus TaxID=553468 RepID=A0A1N7F884_9EURY|nr:hypothetical protein [Haladaptatus litoreus]SIR96543.1 hypothetical protein SAMN05421858_4807 [Haladaptatus litoreus]